jgi:hypothetical protein
MAAWLVLLPIDCAVPPVVPVVAVQERLNRSGDLRNTFAPIPLRRRKVVVRPARRADMAAVLALQVRANIQQRCL